MTITKQQERQRIQQLINLDNQSSDESTRYTDDLLSYIRDHLTAFYQQYGSDEGLTLSQVKARVSNWDINQWKVALNSLGYTTDWPQEAQDRIKAQTQIAGINKQFLIGSIIALGVIGLTVKHQKMIKARINSDAMSESSYLSKGLNLASDKLQRQSRLITRVADKRPWSESLWVDSDKMASDVQYLVNRHLKEGLSLDDLPRLLDKHVNKNQFAPTQSIADRVQQMDNNVQRLIRSESAHVKQQIDIAVYQNQGERLFDWVTEPGACSICQGLADNGPYTVAELPIIPDDSHPNCRCSIVPHRE